MSTKAPRGIRCVITLTGCRNAGKSSLINALTAQQTAIVSDIAGTTTDPVAKAYELLPLGPVTFYDTAGIDDEGELGEQRVQAAKKVLWRTDIAVLVIGTQGITAFERNAMQELADLRLPVVVAFTKADLRSPLPEELAECARFGFSHVVTSAVTGAGIDALKKAIIAAAPEEMRADPILVRDLVIPGDVVVCVVPIDVAAPKGRLILPQVQVLRDILDGNALGLTVKETELHKAINCLNAPPALVITDSQAIKEVAAEVPLSVPLTTFSTLFARYKGDLTSLVQGANALDSLQDGDIVLIGEACSHHATSDDIGRVKLPRWVQEYTGKNIQFEVYSGHDYPEDLERFAMVIHCGACMLNRTEMLRRIKECNRRGIPVTNYGVAISKTQGVLDRVIAPFGL